MVKHALAVLAVAACQGEGTDPPPARPVRDDARVVISKPPPVDAPPSAEPEAADPGARIAELGAVPAWQAVIDRASYLARRGQKGVVYGTLGAPVMMLGPEPPPPPAITGVKPLDAGLVPSEHTWLVDDTEGNGALAIRVKLPLTATPPREGDRVALAGAWQLDSDRRWFWKVDRVTPLPPAPPSDLTDPPAAPGHEIVDGRFPAGVRAISFAKDGDAVYFELTGPRQPVMPGEGWPIADQLGNPIVALLNLPGERPSFGGQDFRTPDERWRLERGVKYWVRIGKIRRPAPDKPALINARTAPVRIK